MLLTGVRVSTSSRSSAAHVIRVRRWESGERQELAEREKVPLPQDQSRAYGACFHIIIRVIYSEWIPSLEQS